MNQPVNQLPLREAALRLAAGETTSRQLVEACLEAVASSANARAAYLLLDAEGALAEADRMDRERRSGYARSPFAGIPVSAKDLFDIAGQVTTAGSRVLAGRPPAAADAPSIARLRQAGFVVLGRTHMTEFAYSGLGLNVHYQDPHSIWREAERHVPGGSSSGAAVSVATGAAFAGIGTDTGGSCRIPAAFNNLVGFKPTAARIGKEGVVPLSTTLDSIGPIARTVDCCAIMDGTLAGEELPAAAIARPRLLVPTNHFLDDADRAVLATFEGALRRLGDTGVEIDRARVETLDRLPDFAALTAAEALSFHRPFLAESASLYDQRVLRRMLAGEAVDARRLAELLRLREAFIADMTRELAPFTALVAPTVAIPPPTMAECADDEGYQRRNRLVLRNTGIANQMNGCSISIPIRDAAVPTGIMCIAAPGEDARLFGLARLIEAAI